jgi:glycosyltransferase involved in cell wall biosynthesis
MHVLILGTRGVPSSHGGFETFAQDLSLYLTVKGHRVTVYCQSPANNAPGEDMWNGVRRVLVPAEDTPAGSAWFDWKATCHASLEDGVILTLGYNTAVLSLLYRVRGLPHVMNMDGVEWKRPKWSKMQRYWLWANEWLGARAANHLIADHPEITNHLARHTSRDKISMIPYGADPVYFTPGDPLAQYGLTSKNYYLVIARPEPENSVMDVVRAYSQKHRGKPLVILGLYSPEQREYHRQVMEAASDEVMFLGSIYDRVVVQALRYHASAYLHGHTVGGTNPSLVESLASGTAIIAHDNRYNQWVAGNGARYFKGTADLAALIDELEAKPEDLATMGEASRKQHSTLFTQDKILHSYEGILLRLSRTEAHSKYEDVATDPV